MKVSHNHHKITEDPRSMGELFMCCTDELADVSFAQAFSLLMDLFVSHAEEFLTISEQEITNFVDKFLEAIPSVIGFTEGIDA